jgi:hypothetical protein
MGALHFLWPPKKAILGSSRLSSRLGPTRKRRIPQETPLSSWPPKND